MKARESLDIFADSAIFHMASCITENVSNKIEEKKVNYLYENVNFYVALSLSQKFGNIPFTILAIGCSDGEFLSRV